MTTIYFIRHAEPDYTNHSDAERQLTQKGIEDSELVTSYLRDRDIDVVFSSPYKRAVDTVRHFADSYHYPIVLVDEFRERKIDSCWIEDYTKFCKMQWENFDYKLTDGESLREVQTRNLEVLIDILKKYKDKSVVIGSHGTALSTVIHYYDPTFDFAQFQQIRYLMPWIVKFTFDDEKLMGIEKIEIRRSKLCL
ncbi:histidine phosphatase family protein [Lacrimispora sp. 38-1]|uniref:histidine phosphatase family protein n=1 Tax=Lacrimispora sp. 38-1 TaxID=3125778 RepID=UPI003CF065EA